VSDIHVINDETPDDVLFPSDKAFGRIADNRPNPGLCANVLGAALIQFPQALLIPRSEWQARIKEREERGWTVRAKIAQAGLPALNQASTNFCWANGPVTACETMRAIAGQKSVRLSSASVACRINGYRNEGGWGQDAIEFLATFGAVPEDRWPNAAIDRKYSTDDNLREAMKYRVTRWCELVPGNLDELISMLLNDKPIAVGYNWWSHEVCAVDPAWVDGEIAYWIRNSWGQWGSSVSYGGGPAVSGFSLIQGSKMKADDAVCPMAVMAS
jgi:hypothetical protein